MIAKRAPRDDGIRDGGDNLNGGGGLTYDRMYVKTEHYKDWYRVNLDGSTEYTHTTYEGSTIELIYKTNHNWDYYFYHPRLQRQNNVGTTSSSYGTVDYDTMRQQEKFNYLANLANAELLAFEQNYRNRMSSKEIQIFDNLSRDEQLGYLGAGLQAQNKAEELFSTVCEIYNGKGDAFRHAYWNALATKNIGSAMTKLLTDAHEDKEPGYTYEGKEKDMDLFNNKVGRDIASNSLNNLAQNIQNALNSGKLRYISNRGTNCRATYDSRLIPTNT